MELFWTLANGYGVTVIIATHEWKRVSHSGIRRIEAKVEAQQNGALSTFTG